MADEYILVADRETGKVGCTIIQTLLGGTVPQHKLAMFEWEVNRIEHMQPYRITDEQLDRLIAERT